MPKDGNKIKLVSGFRQEFGKSKTSINHKPWGVEMEKYGCGYNPETICSHFSGTCFLSSDYFCVQGS